MTMKMRSIWKLLFAGVIFFASCAEEGGEGTVTTENVRMNLTVNNDNSFIITSRDNILEYRAKVSIPAGKIDWQAPALELTLPEILEVMPNGTRVSDASGRSVGQVQTVAQEDVVTVKFLKDHTGNLNYMASQTYTVQIGAKIRESVTFGELEAIGDERLKTTAKFNCDGLSAASSSVSISLSSMFIVHGTSVFTDASCSELMPGVTEATISRITDPVYKAIAMGLHNETYDTEFRTQEFKAWQHPDEMAGRNKTAKYSRLDNPTGIYVEKGSTLTVMVGDIQEGVSINLQTIDLSPEGERVTYQISEGRNDIAVKENGLVYVMYHTYLGIEPAVKMNFATGKVNGYFDSQKHGKSDWTRLLNAAVGPYFDVLGKYAHLTFPVVSFKKFTPDGMALIDKFDEMVYLEMDFMGLVKYNKMFRNRMYFRAAYDTHMWAGDYETGYDFNPNDANNHGTMGTLCRFNTTSSIWGPAHEVGHVNQTRPGLKWHGTTEVTNNIFSLHIQTSFGFTSRLQDSGDYNKYVFNAGAGTIVGGQKAHVEVDVWEKLIPFWQLKLYLVDVLGKTDFYKDLYEHYRVTPTLGSATLTDGVYQLDFVRQVCRVANLDLTDFFETWGFLRAIDLVIGDYGDQRFTITQKQVDDLKAEIAAANYPKPAHNNIHHITDNTVADFRR